MRITILISLSSLLFLSCNLKKETININGIQYTIDGTIENGVAKNYYKNGVLKSYVELANGELNGKSEEYYEDSKLMKTFHLKNGTLHGPYAFYYKTGKLFEKGKYQDGYKIDSSLQYNNDGTIRTQTYYKNNQMISLTEFYEGKEMPYTFIVTKEFTNNRSRVEYHFKMGTEPRQVKFYVTIDGKELLVNGSSYRTMVYHTDALTFTAKGLTQFGNGFKFTVEK